MYFIYAQRETGGIMLKMTEIQIETDIAFITTNTPIPISIRMIETTTRNSVARPSSLPFDIVYIMERGARIELALSAWKAEILPLNEPRIFKSITL